MATVVVVDDDEDTRLFFTDIFQSQKCFAFAGGFSNAAQALTEIPRLQPDFALMDINLPDMDGIECAKRLKHLVPDLRIVIVSGSRDINSFKRSYHAGATYTRGIDLSGTSDGAGGTGGLLARSDSQKIVPAILCPIYPNPQNVVTSYYFSDFDGNVVALVSPSGMILAQYEYDPFGNLISKSGLMADLNKYRFSSREWEGDAGLYYFGFRFYEPNLQKWLNRDPIQEWGCLNLFAYVNNDPSLIDLFGLQTTGEPITSANPPTNWIGPGTLFPNGFPTNPIPPSPIGGPVTNGPPARFQPKTAPSSPIQPIIGGSGSGRNGKWSGGGYCGFSNKSNNPPPPPPPLGTPPPQPSQPWNPPIPAGP